MEYTKFLAELNKRNGAFPALKAEDFAKIMNIVALENRIQALRDLRNDRFQFDRDFVMTHEIKLNEQLVRLRRMSAPDCLLQMMKKWVKEG